MSPFVQDKGLVSNQVVGIGGCDLGLLFLEVEDTIHLFRVWLFRINKPSDSPVRVPRLTASF